jgi:phage/plasmid-associated DNA primase
MDPLADWINECCALGDNLQTVTAELRANYEAWCKDRGERNPVNGREWGKRLRNMKCEPGMGGSKNERRRVWFGIGLLTGCTDSGQVYGCTPPYITSTDQKSLKGLYGKTSESVHLEGIRTPDDDYEEFKA